MVRSTIAAPRDRRQERRACHLRARQVSRPSAGRRRSTRRRRRRAAAADPTRRMSTWRLRRASSAATSSERDSCPRRMIATRSQTRSTSDRTCDEKKIVRPSALSASRMVVERALHQRIEAFGRLVEDGQLGIVLQRLDDADLLAHAARVVAHRPSQRAPTTAPAGRAARRAGPAAGRSARAR